MCISFPSPRHRRLLVSPFPHPVIDVSLYPLSLIPSPTSPCIPFPSPRHRRHLVSPFPHPVTDVTLYPLSLTPSPTSPCIPFPSPRHRRHLVSPFPHPVTDVTLQELVKMFNFHHYDTIKHSLQRIDPRRTDLDRHSHEVMNLLFGAATGDVTYTLRR